MAYLITAVTSRQLLKNSSSPLSAACNIISCNSSSSKKDVDLGPHRNHVMNEAKDRKHNLSRMRGIDIIRNPALNKGTAFTLKERQMMGIHGLIPTARRSVEGQMVRVLTNFNNRSSDLDRYIYLMALQDRNEKLFYKVLNENIERMMPIVYTPTVGQACLKYGVAFRRPRGLFISIKDKGHIYDVLCNWPERNVKAIVVTDGERILGLGDLGANGMGIPVGKLALYTALGGIHPAKCLPVALDVGTNNKELQKDSLYIGHQFDRVTGPEYDEFVDEFMEAVAKRFGSTCLIQFEDFGNHNAFRFLHKYRDQYCTFNDDIQGTASVAAAGVFVSLRITGKKLIDNTFLFMGAGGAALGIADLLTMAMVEEGATENEARSKIWMVDIGGLLVNGRPVEFTGHGGLYAKDYKHMDNLEEIVADLKPSILIGASAVAGAFSKNVLQTMAKNNERPVIFALSNPTNKAECTAEAAYTETDGRCVFVSGSPFEPVTVNGKTHCPGQGNNAYIFPGVALGVLTCGVRHIQKTIFLLAAKSLSETVTQEHLEQGRLYPPLDEIHNISMKIAVDIAEEAYRTGEASLLPEPVDKEAYIRSFLYNTEYDDFIPETWDWGIGENDD